MTVISMLFVQTLKMVLYVLVRVAILEMEQTVAVSHFVNISNELLCRVVTCRYFFRY